MNRSYRIAPVCTGDVSGVCSALFELGGMVVIHDPSGCNSTYNTHDEIRWYDHDSLIFISGLKQRDAVMGNDEKFVRDIVEAAQQLHPAFIALCSSPIPYIAGTDFDALARLTEGRTGIPCFAVHTNGMHDYVRGAGDALRALCEHYLFREAPPPKTASDRLRVNLMGVTPLNFPSRDDRAAPDDFLSGHGFVRQCCFAMDSNADELRGAAGADVSLVVSSVGLPAAEYLRSRFGVPYVVGLPLAGLEQACADALKRSSADGQCRNFCRGRGGDTPGEPLTIVGEAVTAGALAASLSLREQCPTRVLCVTEAPGDAPAPGDLCPDGEEALEAALSGASRVIADPLYRPLVPAGAMFYPLPQLAVSGRCYLRTMDASLFHFSIHTVHQGGTTL